MLKTDLYILFERFLCKVEKIGSCWIWTGSASNMGYGQVRIGKRLHLVHRVVFELLVGPVPRGLDLDHKCKQTRCFNPRHIEAVLHRENCRRGNVGAHNKIKTHCPHGHEYTPENTYVVGGGRRQCKACTLTASRQRRERARARS